MRRPRTITKKMCLFVRFFTCNQKYQNNAIFVHIEGFRPCLSKPSYGASQWALMVRLMQKERPKSPQKSLFLENQATLVIWSFWQNRPFWPFWPPISEAGWTSRKKKVPFSGVA